MPIQILRKLKWPLFGAAAAALIAGATAVAGSGVGGVFNLGVENTVNSSTRLIGNTPTDPQLHVINSANAAAIRGDSDPGIGVKGSSAGGTGVNGSSNGGSGVIGIHSSATGTNPGVSGQTNSTDPGSAGVVGRNNGGGPGLSAVVASQAIPPLKVNSTARVPFLNADYVDGRHANGLLRISEATSDEASPPNAPSPLRTVHMTAPTPGYVFLIGSALLETESLFCNPCMLWINFRDPTRETDQVSTAQVASVRSGSSALEFQSVTTTWVVPVTSGPHSFVLEGSTFPPVAPVEIENATATALFVPFNGLGNTP